MSQDRLVENLLYFPTRDAAEHAGAVLGPHGYEVQIKPGADGTNWLAQANRRQVVTIEAVRAMRAELTALAEAGGGEYDGWGAGE